MPEGGERRITDVCSSDVARIGFMRSSTNDIGGDAALVVVAVWLLVIGAWIALGGNFTAGLFAIGCLAALASVAAIRYVSRRGI